MYDVKQVVQKIKQIAREKDIKTAEMLEICELSKNTLSSMSSRGSWIQANSLAKIADVLDCSVDYLLGRSETPNPENAVVKTNSGNVVKGINAVDFPVTVSFPESSLDENQRELLELFGRLPYKEKISLMQELIQRTEKS